jgi:hypothetical protein
MYAEKGEGGRQNHRDLSEVKNKETEKELIIKKLKKR